ncbi:MgtC/SapB family protein [Pseudonocardia sp. GCM10023141]|uniref:MgtC/SapB family protein n=1 Tax=Pseudonocardia sp. GCM10023141 TaxID=3252653 RepID=UPI003618C3DC
MTFGEPTGQGWVQFGELAIAFVLSAAIGLERELRQKSAGLRTHTIIGFAAALMMLVSKYGFTDVLSEHVTLDPSRVAAQIVSGIGFIGGGLIFVRRDAVRGLTTAAAVWLTTAVGMAAGAGLPLLALATTLAYFVVAYAFPMLTSRLPRARPGSTLLEVTYVDGRGLLRRILNTCTTSGWVVADLETRPMDEDRGAPVSVLLRAEGKGARDELVADLAEIEGVLGVSTRDGDDS